MVTFSIKNMIIRASEGHLLHPLPRDRIKQVSHSWRKLDHPVTFKFLQGQRLPVLWWIIDSSLILHDISAIPRLTGEWVTSFLLKSFHRSLNCNWIFLIRQWSLFFWEDSADTVFHLLDCDWLVTSTWKHSTKFRFRTRWNIEEQALGFC